MHATFAISYGENFAYRVRYIKRKLTTVKPFLHYTIPTADGDGYGDPNVSLCVCKSNPPAGYVKNNYDWDDHKKAEKSCDERITM